MSVSIGAVHSASGAAAYFAADNYYSAEQAEGTSQWAGQGANEAGLAGAVDTVVFEKILNGVLPDGTQVGDPEKRDHGRDFTFSMPKSLSLLALVSGDKRILEAHVEAVRETMQWAEKNLAEARIKVDGKDVAVRTGNLTYALFQHDTSRKTDPQSHIHAVIANLTRLPEDYRQADKIDPNTGEVTRDDGWRAWHNGAMYKASTTLTSIANANLRARVEQLGYKAELVAGGKHGAFEVIGPDGERIAKTALDGFSKRGQDIKAKAQELGVHSPQGRREITKRTRDAKIDAGDRDALQSKWREEAKELGYNGDSIFKAASLACEKGTTERGVIAVGAAVRDTIQNIGEHLRRGDDPLIDQGLSRLTRTPNVVRTQYATASAVRILSEREAAFKTSDVIKTAVDLGLKGVTHASVEKRMEQLAEKGQLVVGQSQRHDRAVDFVTTKDAIEQERRILKAMDTGMGQGRPLMPANEAARALQALAGDKQLNPEQLAAAIQIVSSTDRIVQIQGRAGSGKSTLLQPVAKAEAIDAAARLLGQDGHKTLILTGEVKGDATALAFQNKMVGDLKADTGLEAMTVDSFIYRNTKFLDGNASPQSFAARKSELQGRYLILDEGSMNSNEQMDRLTSLANLMEVGRLAIISDRKQLSAISAGKPAAMMQARSIQDSLPVSEVNINMRQTNHDMQLVANLADAGNIRGALDVLGDRVIESNDRTGDAARAWLKLSPQERGKTILLPSGRQGRAEANALIQAGLKAEGSIFGEGRNFNVRESVQLAHEELRYAQNWREAEFLEVGSKYNSLGLQPGDYRIERVYDNGRIGLSDIKGRKLRIDPLRIDPNKSSEALKLANEKAIKVHEGETIRWTASDKKAGRDMLNASIAHVERVGKDGITVRLGNGEIRELVNGDLMLKRMDLAYAINTHMAQGITSDTVFSVMGSTETTLSNARSFLVNHTRQRSDVRLFTDDKAKLIKQLESNRGDKTSAVETIGELAVEKILNSKKNGSDHKSDAAKDRGDDRIYLNDLPDLKAKSGTANLNDAADLSGTQATNEKEVAGRDLGLPRGNETSGPKKNASEKGPSSSPISQEERQLDRSKGLEL
ncbi:MAG: conjugative relaxase [Sphingorhabdus sp.]|uniref:MobF family relaxase n=1 Tax=Sphingorhabdus sp. TaxID=1902408 RepID=UPI0025CF7097|nr:MobF family relaxase [Sphingorhabdus sp.]MCO4091554.1 conjugative relaxase [Sphingorhabdus sp.]